MKLGQVLRKEREKKGLSIAEVAAGTGLEVDDYERLERGEVDEAETWGPRLAELAIQLETPTSRLLAESGRAADTRPGQAGVLIRGHRERCAKTVAEMAGALAIPAGEYAAIEAGTSPVERWGPVFLAVAEAVEQPVFNFFYPCGLPFQELDDYP